MTATRVMTIVPSRHLAAILNDRMRLSPLTVTVKEFHHYPPWDEFSGAVRAHDPQAVLIDICSDPSAIRVTAEMQRRWPEIAFIALDNQPDATKLVDLMRSGVREFLAVPFAEAEYIACFERVRELVNAGSGAPGSQNESAKDRSTKAVYAFLPSKPGTGASTIAINTALALSRLDDNRTLLIDFDFGCGVTRFQLKSDHPYSVQDALDRAATLEPGVWAELAAQCTSRLDLLASVHPGPGIHASAASIGPLFDFARRNYNSIVMDCSGYLDGFAIEYLAQCRRILLITEPDMTSVHLGREKLRILQSVDLQDRVELVINRWRRNPVLTLADIEGVLGIAAEHLVPDDPKSVYQGVLRGCGVDPVSSIGKACMGIAEALGLSGTGPVTPVVPDHTAVRKRMVEYFSVAPARYTP